MEGQEYTSKTLDHLGLVAGKCQEIGISQLTDRYCPSDSPDQIVSTGKALEAMILNGLGFVNKRFGKTLREYVVQGLPEKFLTTQHERDVETGLDYRGARFYDSEVGRFLGVDPLAGMYAGWSPYGYVLGLSF